MSPRFESPPPASPQESKGKESLSPHVRTEARKGLSAVLEELDGALSRKKCDDLVKRLRGVIDTLEEKASFAAPLTMEDLSDVKFLSADPKEAKALAEGYLRSNGLGYVQELPNAGKVAEKGCAFVHRAGKVVRMDFDWNSKRIQIDVKTRPSESGVSSEGAGSRRFEIAIEDGAGMPKAIVHFDTEEAEGTKTEKRRFVLSVEDLGFDPTKEPWKYRLMDV
ncbi:hypothetical protein L0Y59_01385 [Candidatus Uhrbacteria bacterium]|nr:hypothetical protein [Candidatus Uhrbacteria bacterium]